MTVDAPAEPAASYAVKVYSAVDLEVVSGANFGDPLMPLAELCPGDVYELFADAAPQELRIRDGGNTGHHNRRVLPTGQSGHSVADGSELGQAGDALTLEARLTFMGPDGHRLDLLVIGLQAPGAEGRSLHVLPMAPIEPKVPYTLLTASADPGDVRLSDITPVAVTRGTFVTMADGCQCPVERLKTGDRVLTRDHGPQPVRWIGARTVRAVGAYAPVVIGRGVLANESDLIVSQNQRIFVYQRGRNRLTETAELLVKARDLVDGENVFLRRGGFVEYFHLIFAAHEIIYAECTPTESLLVNDGALKRLPEDMAQEVRGQLPDTRQRPHFGTEADRALLARIGPAVLHRPPSRRQ